MSFYNTFLKYKNFGSGHFSLSACLQKDRLAPLDFLGLLSPLAQNHLEAMAKRSNEITVNNFGRVMQLYTPLYLSNYCDNKCLYCGFNSKNKIPRRKLSLDEVEKEARFIYGTGLRHILVLTGDSVKESPLSYIRACVKILKKYFSSISIEIYALSKEEYSLLIADGVDGLTIYQETYDEKIYDKAHQAGPKKDYKFRLDAPQRAAESGMRFINIGVLLGLSEWRRDVFLLGMHAKYLQDNFSETEISVSLPRLQPHTGGFKAHCKAGDKDVAQAMLALRLFLPRVGIVISTRESPCFRENLAPLGVTRMSAGSTTAVGGHTLEYSDKKAPSQFKIQDTRGVEEIKAMLEAKGYQPVFKDWARI